ncbi:hypothetical protein [Oceanirhabdus seepicola]|uniref:adenosine deaminase n=1 Tax=Oceanirhabdus seepicola TaxID=2828781 RepID=A0A9J6P4V8_9CLOT|nr:hypothetical protein [Oceanirhabdus seepicola]MCM1991174.1 hypothetical protein [Oceanirhabdus seepicola]
MDITRGCIDIIFRKQSPEKILNSFFGNKNNYEHLHDKVNKDIFITNALEEFRHYSEDEVVNIYDKLFVSMKDMREISRGMAEEKKFSSVFNLLIQFTDDVLVERDKEPFCKFEHMLRWRMLSHKLEQDIFTTSYLAYRDVLSNRKRKYFSWEPVIRSDNNRLHEMLQKGLAENHFHLKGSAPYFNLTWISLMNRVIGRENEFKKSGIGEKKLIPDVMMDDRDEFIKTNLWVKRAAIIRAFLFSELMDIEFFDVNESEVDNENNKTKISKMKELKRYLTGLNLELDNQEIQEKLNILKMVYGYKFKNDSDGTESPIDYCITKNLVSSNRNSNLFLVGERYFLYLMFKKIYERDKKILKYADLFYVYLIIKAKFRGELIQINDRVGFKNFADYQGRKTNFLKKDPLLNNAIYNMAIRSTMKDQNVKSLEARICPDDTAEDTAKLINDIDRIIDNEEKVWKNDKSSDKDLERLIELTNDKDVDENKDYFYVIHFPKRRDKTKYDEIDSIDKKTILSMKARDSEVREYSKEQAFNIVALREKINPAVKRILGIDACANEIGCRPEVFAHSFRYLSNHTNSIEESIIVDNEIPQLRITYHAGEDFLDLVDGIRAIEEAIMFLNLKSGDRIGHALALGVNVEDWYKNKMYRLMLPKQDYLDNIVWILAKMREFNIHDNESLKYNLEDEFNRLYHEVYLSGKKDDRHFKYVNNHMTYYDAWKLRGDDPYLYIDNKYNKEVEILYWDRCKINNLVDDSIRENSSCSYIYSNYHFNPEVKKKGAEQYEFSVSKAYIKVVVEIQMKMQKILGTKGIGIETNPSSNYLIGNFKRYDKHPIVNFFNLGLTADRDEIEKCPQLFVSINTDDQGVFGTYLENEYALMAIALEKAKDENGEPLYNKAMIYDWLDRVRQMGLEQSFNIK